MKELIELPVEGLTPAMQASLLRELSKQLNIPDNKFEESAKKPLTAEERKEAVLRLNSEINRISEVVRDEAKVNSTEIKPITFVNKVNQESSSQAEANQFTVTTIEPEVLKKPTNKNDDNNGSPVEESPEDRVQSLTADSQIKQFVIPIILDRLNIYGKSDKETQGIIYKSEEYTASIKLQEDSQTLSLDRNLPDSEESREALLACHDKNSEEYSIIINNLTKKEFEHFKALFDQQQAHREQSQQQFKKQDSAKELN
jgi:phosphotransferase system IIB component